MGTEIDLHMHTYIAIESIDDCLNLPCWLIPFRFVKMSLFGNYYLCLFRLNFVFNTKGLVFENLVIVVLLPS